MKMKLIKAIAVLGLAGLAGQASADMISGDTHPGYNTADVAWHVNHKGHLIVTVNNMSTGTAAVTLVQFELDDGTIAALTDVDGSGYDKNWGYSDESGSTKVGKLSGKLGSGIQGDSKGTFRFVGDFSGLETISNLTVRFHRAKSEGMGKIDYGYGCYSGCASSKSKPASNGGNGEYKEVPEPGMLVLFGTGLMGMGVALRRRQKKAIA